VFIQTAPLYVYNARSVCCELLVQVGLLESLLFISARLYIQTDMLHCDTIFYHIIDYEKTHDIFSKTMQQLRQQKNAMRCLDGEFDNRIINNKM
jgi:hypothetical protein